MDFQTYINESSLNNLHQSAVAAFPGTTKRQHATQPIRITRLEWIPFLGMKTLYVKGLAQNEGKEYKTAILFKGVNYHRERDVPNLARLMTGGEEYLLDRLSLEDTDVMLRCNCGDFYWRFNYYNHLDRSLYGRKRRAYEAVGGRPPANPTESPGMCKHLMKTVRALRESGVIQ
jgi:hypothetical protein